MKVVTDRDMPAPDKAPEMPQTRKKKNKFSYDLHKLYFGEPYTITPEVGSPLTIYQPNMEQVLGLGDQSYNALNFLQTLRIFTTNTTENRVLLWDGKLLEIKDGKPFTKRYNWNRMSDYSLFLKLLFQADQRVLDILFDNFKLKNMTLLTAEDGTQILADIEHNLFIDEKMYESISDYIRTMFHMFPKEEKVKGKTAQNTVIAVERAKLSEKQNDVVHNSYYLPLISYYLCHPGTVYTKDDLRHIGIYEFMYSIARLQVYDRSIATLNGILGGLFFDAKKIKPEEYNAAREI